MAKHVEALRMEGCGVLFEVERQAERFELRVLTLTGFFGPEYLRRVAWSLTRQDVADLAKALLQAIAYEQVPTVQPERARDAKGRFASLEPPA